MNLYNKDVFLHDPATRKLLNDGIADVNDNTNNPAELGVLRYELETFVCNGQYEHGIKLILESFLNNIGYAEQSAAWVSGFFGSGKSHLVKMLRALWVNTSFSDGATAQGVATLPQSVRDLLKELEVQGKRHGGLHAASGTLGSGADGSIRLALLQIVFRSVGLPEQYHIARFVMWLKKEKIYNCVKGLVESDNLNWQEELDSFYFSESLHKALIQVKPNIFSSANACVDLLAEQYKFVQDITSEKMVKGIKESLTVNGKFPLTLLVLDELQSYIGENSDRSLAVQEVIQDCCKKFNGKLKVVATGQTAITGTSNLKKLEGRFTNRIELSDSDVGEVIRKVILAKKPDMISHIDDFVEHNMGEITRHLNNTRICHRQSDIEDFSKDYPILPIRKRFWEEAFRVLDPTGTYAQLRNQLAMIDKLVKESAEYKLGYIVPADYLYFHSAIKLLGNMMVSRRFYENTMKWYKGSEEEKLTSRACALVYLINKIKDRNKDLGLCATADTIADLMIVDLAKGSASLRSKLPQLLDLCPILMKVEDEYRIQTEESTAWNDEFGHQRSTIGNEAFRISGERHERLKRKVFEKLRSIRLSHGNTKVKREISLHYEEEAPSSQDKLIYVWIRDGWTIPENSVVLEAKQAGYSLPTIHVYLPRKSSDELSNAILDFKAASATIEKRGVPATIEGQEARAAMTTTQSQSESRINHVLDEIMNNAKVFQAGGNEINQTSFDAMIQESVSNSLDRMYSYFDMADNVKWAKVFDRAKGGATDPLSLIGYRGEVQDNPVCKEVLSFIGNEKKGSDIRKHFSETPYGWPQDAIDAALLVLVSSELVRAEDNRMKLKKATEIERKAIGITIFKLETVVLTTNQKINIRKLMILLDLKINQTNLNENSNAFLDKLEELANKVGGDAPKPEKQDVTFIMDLKKQSGNAQLFSIFNQSSFIEQRIKLWKPLHQKILKRWSHWLVLKNLARHAQSLDQDNLILDQVSIIEQKRQLLVDPDLIEPLIKSLTDLLRTELNKLEKKWDDAWSQGETLLVSDENWDKIDREQKYDLRLSNQLVDKSKPEFSVQDSEAIIKTLDSIGIVGLRDRIAAMDGRFKKVLVEAARLMEPKTQVINVKKPTIRTTVDVDRWLEETRVELNAALEKGPVIIR